MKLEKLKKYQQINEIKELTREIIDIVFSKTDRFKNAEKAKTICEMRLSGAKYTEISKAVNLSPDRCRQYVANALAAYRGYLRKQPFSNYDRIKNMSLDEMAQFFAETIKTDFIVIADRYICTKCKAEHGGSCPIHDDAPCLYELDNKSTIKMWLEGEAYV